MHIYKLAYSNIKLSPLILLIIYLSLFSFKAAYAASCSGNQLITATLPTGSRWEMCWELQDAAGIVLKDLSYATPNGTFRRVLKEASLAQIHITFDDGTPGKNHLTALSQGGGLGVTGNVHVLSQLDCPDGTLSSVNGMSILCHRIVERGYAYKSYNVVSQGYALKILSRVTIGLNTYIIRWRFYDDGSIEPSIGLSGELPVISSVAKYGWQLDATGTVAVAFTNSYYWRLDFDLAGNGNNDVVEQLEVVPSADRRTKSLVVNQLFTEVSQDLFPDRKRSWRVRDANIVNSDGHYISYHLEPLHAAHGYIGNTDASWAENDLHVTVNKSCEKFIVDNPTDNNCGADISEFVNGESLLFADIVLWYRLNYHHVPRSEDEPGMPVHWDGFLIVPRDWTATSPLSKLDSLMNRSMDVLPFFALDNDQSIRS